MEKVEIYHIESGDGPFRAGGLLNLCIHVYTLFIFSNKPTLN